ncbi:hypothetical protein PM082_023535 [Marasmius tenuissimus]|nr:hypothetical protein PM082_023535 [Marasmius tenuissimus]
MFTSSSAVANECKLSIAGTRGVWQTGLRGRSQWTIGMKPHPVAQERRNFSTPSMMVEPDAIGVVFHLSYITAMAVAKNSSFESSLHPL